MSSELYYMENDEKKDESLHAPILADGERYDHRLKAISRAVLMRRGFTEEEAREMLGEK